MPQILPIRVGEQKLAFSAFSISFVRNNSISNVGYMLSWTGIVLFYHISLVY
jgi:hypothetical protein